MITLFQIYELILPFFISDNAAVHMLKKPMSDKEAYLYKASFYCLDNFGSEVTNSNLPECFATPLPYLDYLIIHFKDVLSSILATLDLIKVLYFFTG